MLNKELKVKPIVQISIMAAITCLVTMVIRIPTQIGYTHLGDSMVFTAVVLLGRRKGTLSSALGMALADLLGGFFVWMPFTFIIKGIMAYIAGTIAFRNDYRGNNLVNNIFAFVVAGIWMVAAYYGVGIIISRYILSKALTFNQAAAIAASGIVGNVLEVIVSIALALPLSMSLKGKIKFLQ